MCARSHCVTVTAAEKQAKGKQRRKLLFCLFGHRGLSPKDPSITLSLVVDTATGAAKPTYKPTLHTMEFLFHKFTFVRASFQTKQFPL